MTIEVKVNDKVHETALVLANAGALAGAILKRVAGNDISTALNGSPVTREMTMNLVGRTMVRELSQPENNQAR